MSRKQSFDTLMAFGGLEKILPNMIESLELVGRGIGALRTVKLKGGGTVVERMDAAFDERLFDYAITFNDVMPFKNYCAAVTLEMDANPQLT